VLSVTERREESKDRMEPPCTEKMEERNIMRKDVNETWKTEKGRKINEQMWKWRV
jgi:hypothetical protein